MTDTPQSDHVRASGRTGRRLPRRLVLASVVGIIVVLLVIVVRALTIAGEVPGGTRVAGIEIGGLSPGAAEAKLSRELSDDAERPIAVTAAGHRFSISPAEAGLALDVKATVAAAGGGAPLPSICCGPWPANGTSLPG